MIRTSIIVKWLCLLAVLFQLLFLVNGTVPDDSNANSAENYELGGSNENQPASPPSRPQSVNVFEEREFEELVSPIPIDVPVTQPLSQSYSQVPQPPNNVQLDSGDRGSHVHATGDGSAVVFQHGSDDSQYEYPRDDSSGTGGDAYEDSQRTFDADRDLDLVKSNAMPTEATCVPIPFSERLEPASIDEVLDWLQNDNGVQDDHDLATPSDSNGNDGSFPQPEKPGNNEDAPAGTNSGNPADPPEVSSPGRGSLLYDFIHPPQTPSDPADDGRHQPDSDAFLTMLSGIPAAQSYFGIVGVFGQCSVITDRFLFGHLAGRTCPKVDECPPHVCRYLYGQMKRFSNSFRPEYKCHVPAFARRVGAGYDRPWVMMVNTSEVMELIYSDRVQPCVLVNFYSTTCPFSAHLAPNYNALPRAFDHLSIVAVDVSKASKVNTRFGISGTPTVLMFHRGKAVVRYNASDYSLMALKEFVEYNTDLLAFPDVEVEDDDLFGPLRAGMVLYWDPWLYLAWLFIVACALYHGARSAPFRYAAEVIRQNWQEANENAM